MNIKIFTGTECELDEDIEVLGHYYDIVSINCNLIQEGQTNRYVATVAYKEKDCVEENNKIMSTQIQPTPIVTGESAKKIEEQLKIESSEETERGVEVLKEMFESKTKGNNDTVRKLTELLVACNVTFNPKAVAETLIQAGVTLNPYSKHCYQCKHFLGGGDWNLCCNLKYELCYKPDNACSDFEEMESN